ncbi:double-stranded RNA binding motif domain-containing protein [Acaryochloris marina]|uniref:Double-stranded RNA binding motif domain protein n=1 Tax=Acaryochloris marina (strain MBIC 11017) TaxID=329726 RepID=A8ZQC1_ACAM1|nr:double-stranded RNA binding motif domain-containing protein [Acaryochloris marina]ABW33207.1 double-stranded RNA binding motif domain protein [Acaryochloris marina MBIC11017]
MRSQHSHNLNIHITEEQIGFLAYLFPNDDPEDALVKLLERARKQAIRQAEKQIRVLHLGQESEENQGEIPEKPISQGDDWVENPIGQLQELCQKQQITLPRYGFSERPNGFSCNVQAMGLQENGEGSSKQEAKTKAARELLSKINSRL